MNNPKQLTITISGAYATGKSTIARVLENVFCAELNIACEVNDVDVKDSEEVYFKKLNDIRNNENFSVTINVVQTSKEPF